MTTTLTVVCRNEEYTSRDRDPDDSWDVGDVGHSYYGCTVYTGPAGGRGSYGSYTEEFEVPFDAPPGTVVYPVIVRYGTGSTFGRTDGLVTVLGVWEKYEEALAAERAARQSVTDHGAAGRYETTVAGQTFYTGTWIGYFEHLEDVIVETKIVRS